MSRIVSVLAAAVFAIATSVLGVSHFGGQASPAVEPTASANQTVVENQIVVGNQTVSAQVKGIDSVGITVHDMESELKFFTEVLPFKKVSDDEVVGEDFEELFGVFGCRARVVRLQLGKEFITLTQFLAPRGRPIPVDSNSNDGWFQHIAIVVSDMEAAYAHLRKHNVEHASTGPQTLPDWNPNAGGIKAFYFKDPENHIVEIIWFPEGKGDPKWQGQKNLFLGIDHTAIAVSDTEVALKFYRDFLGMEVAGESENYGPEQERLNNVFGARLRITGLKAKSGPGIELLEYLAPSNGLPYPISTKMNDLWSWRTRLIVESSEEAMKSARTSNVDFVSPGSVDIIDNELGIDRGVTVSGPFGHRMILVEESAK
ncbi:VOC family protein [Mariniblastus sp.]|nr:VOC family protein [Mariniblastus sp.]